MLHRLLVALGLGLLVTSVSPASSATLDTVPTEPRERVEYHVHEAEDIAQHFETVVASPCPRFERREEWDAYVNDEVDRMVLLLAHLEQAWVEAKRTPDDDIRREAKAPRRRVDEMRTLVGKLERCADDNGATFAPFSVWRRIEREVPRKQADIALPR